LTLVVGGVEARAGGAAHERGEHRRGGQPGLGTGGPRAAHARVSRTVGLAAAAAAAAAVVLSVVPQLVLGVAPLTGAG